MEAWRESLLYILPPLSATIYGKRKDPFNFWREGLSLSSAIPTCFLHIVPLILNTRQQTWQLFSCLFCGLQQFQFTECKQTKCSRKWKCQMRKLCGIVCTYLVSNHCAYIDRVLPRWWSVVAVSPWSRVCGWLEYACLSWLSGYLWVTWSSSKSSEEMFCKSSTTSCHVTNQILTGKFEYQEKKGP